MKNTCFSLIVMVNSIALEEAKKLLAIIICALVFKCDVSDETDTSETSKNLVNLLINRLYTYELFHLV